MTKNEAIEHLKKNIKPGDKIFTSMKSVSRSGMSRKLQAFVIRDNEPWNISGYVAAAIGLPLDRDIFAVKISGCGMDMGFELVYQLGYALWPKGDGKFTRNRNGNNGPETDGGYCLYQAWL